MLGRFVNPRGEAPFGLVLGAFQVIGGTGRWVSSYSRSHGSLNSLQNAGGGLGNSLHSFTTIAGMLAVLDWRDVGVFSVVLEREDVEDDMPKK